MKWTFEGKPCPVAVFAPFTPATVLYDFDGPRIFTVTLSQGDTILVVQCDEDETASRYIVVPCDAALVDSLQSGRISVRDALLQPWGWIVEQAHGGEIEGAWRVDARALPDAALPRPGVPLLPALRPLLSVRMVGADLGPSNVPLSVIRRACDGVTGALKVLVERVLEIAASAGRPTESLRRLYDLPAQRVAFGSFELVLAPPASALKQTSAEEKEQQGEALASVGALLQKGLLWATSEKEPDMPGSEEARIVLEALAKLVPPKHGLVTEVHLAGRLAGSGNGPHVLTRRASARVRHALESVRRDVRPVKLTGLVREFDKDRLAFTLRDARGRDLARCAFTETLYDDALSAFETDAEVDVLGHESISRSVVEVLSIAPLEPLALPEGSAPDPHV